MLTAKPSEKAEMPLNRPNFDFKPFSSASAALAHPAAKTPLKADFARNAANLAAMRDRLFLGENGGKN
jgi:hypothetical protein